MELRDDLDGDGLGKVVGEGADTSGNFCLQDRKYYFQAVYGVKLSARPYYRIIMILCRQEMWCV